MLGIPQLNQILLPYAGYIAWLGVFVRVESDKYLVYVAMVSLILEHFTVAMLVKDSVGVLICLQHFACHQALVGDRLSP